MDNMRFALGSSNPSVLRETVVEVRTVTWGRYWWFGEGQAGVVGDNAVPRRSLGQVHQVCRRRVYCSMVLRENFISIKVRILSNLYFTYRH